MPSALEMRHRHDGQQVPDVEGVPGWVEADVERDLFGVEKLLGSCGELLNKAALLQHVESAHVSSRVAPVSMHPLHGFQAL